MIIFGVWYWEFDRGGPGDRAQAVHVYPDFLFPQMTSPEMSAPDWEPAFGDYLYLSFTNATAFSPTDVLPLSRWAKGAMALQAGGVDRDRCAGDRAGGQHPQVAPGVMPPRPPRRGEAAGDRGMVELGHLPAERHRGADAGLPRGTGVRHLSSAGLHPWLLPGKSRGV